jgi:hypothetical protein
VVTRRRYKARADHAPADVNVAVVPAPASPVAPGPTPEGDANPLQRALAAQAHAEALQRQHTTRAQIGLSEPPIDPATRQTIDAHIDAMAGLTEHKRRFLKSHPSLLTEPYVQLMRHAHAMALHAGIVDDSAQMDAAILAGVARDIEHHRALSQLTSASARPTPKNHQAHQDATEAASELAREAEAHFAEHHQPAPTAPPPLPKRTMPMQAPVSRDSPSVSGHPQQNNTLTAAEREIARNSFTDPNMSNTEKELLYLRNRQKYSRMKADGSYSEQTG